MGEYAYEPIAAGMPEREPATQEIGRSIERLDHLNEQLAKRLDAVLRSPHPTASEAHDRPQASSPLRNVAMQLDASVDRLGYIVDRIDL